MKTIHWGSAAVGAVAFVLSHLIVFLRWQTWFEGGAWTPWFLNDGAGAILLTAVCLFIAGLAVSVTARPARAALVRGVNAAVGASVAMTVVLVAFVGAGTIFPIVLAAGVLLATVSTMTASALVAMVKSR